MREIEFRGKEIDSNKWYFGMLTYFDDDDTYYINFKDNGDYVGTEVYPNTLGQYIGLTDKNGTKIFDGDIVKIDNVVYVVRFGYHIAPCSDYPYDYGNAYGFYLENNDERFSIEKEDVIEVIGNIYDNPELLEVQ